MNLSLRLFHRFLSHHESSLCHATYILRFESGNENFLVPRAGWAVVLLLSSSIRENAATFKRLGPKMYEQVVSKTGLGRE